MYSKALYRFALVGALLCGLAFSQGCNSAKLDPAGAYAGDATLHSLDQGIATSYDVIDLFLSWELTNKATVSASVHQFAEKLRKEAPGWFRSATILRQAYISEPTPENRLKLQNALGILRAAMDEAKRYMLQPAKTAYLPRLWLRHRITV